MAVRSQRVRLDACLALLVLSATATLAGGNPYHYERQSVGPIALQAAAIGSGPGHLVGAIIDVSDIAASTNYVSGTCVVRQASALQGNLFGPFSYACGADRDNDGLVTRLDTSSAALGDKNTGSHAGHDDDFAGRDVPPGGQGSVPICFRADVDSGPIVNGYPVSAVWDDFAVFVAMNVDSAAVAAGTFALTIDVAHANNGACTPSSHGPDWG